MLVQKSYFGTNYFLSSSGTLAGVCYTATSDWRSSCESYFATTCSGLTLYASGSSTKWKVIPRGADGFNLVTVYSPTACGYDIIFTDSVSYSATELRRYHCMTMYEVFYQVDPQSDAYFSTKPWYSLSSTTPSPTSLLGLASPIPSSSSIATPTTIQSVDLPTAAPAPEKGASKVWIAGAVIGGLGLIAVAGLSFYLIQRRRRKRAENYQVAPQMSAFSPQQPNAEGFITPLPPPGYHDAKDNRLSQNTVPNTYSMYSQDASSTPGVQAMGSLIQELPELVQPPRGHA